MKIWMKVTSDDLELPVAVADSAEELAEMLGISRATIYASISRWKSGERSECPYRVVEIDAEPKETTHLDESDE
jgi:hypothetical protein